jgi:hypothetical protein
MCHVFTRLEREIERERKAQKYTAQADKSFVLQQQLLDTSLLVDCAFS